MSGSRLLIDIEVLEFLRTLRRHEQEHLLKRFREIATSPAQFSDFVERDSAGRRVDDHVSGKYAIKFWDEFADRQLKILDVHPADLSA